MKTRKDKRVANKPKGYWAQVAERSIGILKSFLSLILYPFICYTSVLLLCFFFWHTHHELVLLLTFVFVTLGVVLCLSESGAASGGKLKMFLGALGAINAVFGLIIGLLVYSDHMYHYWKISDRSLYQNVLPSSPSKGYDDAGRMYFALDSVIDVENSLGFKVGSSYCVAPIVSGDVTSKVSFWAVGIDCCTARAQFTCPHVADPYAHGGAVIMDAHPLSLQVDKKMMFTHAAKQAASVYSLVISDDPIFVQWDVDPDSIMTGYYNSGYKLMTESILVDFGVCIVFAMIMQTASGKIAKQQEVDARATAMDRNAV